MSFIVYQHLNLKNGKAYIGVTSQTLEHRWEEHCADARSRERGRKFLRAINKYGVEAWRADVLHTVVTFEEALALEIQEILARNTLKKGYNSTSGGEGSHGFKHRPEGVAKRTGANHVQAKRFIVTFPDGSEETILGLTDFCRRHGIDHRKAHETTWNSGRSCQGFRFRLDGEIAVAFTPKRHGPRLTSEQREEIAQLALAGVPNRELVAQFDVSDVTIGKIKRLAKAGLSVTHTPKEEVYAKVAASLRAICAARRSQVA